MVVSEVVGKKSFDRDGRVILIPIDIATAEKPVNT
jgi:hypothetical protein